MPAKDDRNSDETLLAERFNWWWRKVFIPPDNGFQPNLSALEKFLPPNWREVVDDPSRDLVMPDPSRAPTDLAEGLVPLFGALERSREYSAFLYEMGKRVTGRYEFRKPWLALKEKQKRILALRWPEPHQATHRVFELGDSKAPVREGWTEKLRVCTSWNLRLNNDTLAAYFIRHFIEPERRRLQIPNPKPNQDQARRPRSWRPVELMDIEQHSIRKLDHGERSQVSKAERFFKSASKEYEGACNG